MAKRIANLIVVSACSEFFDDAEKNLGASKIKVPEDLEQKVRHVLDENDDLRWDDAIRIVLDETLDDVREEKREAKAKTGNFVDTDDGRHDRPRPTSRRQPGRNEARELREARQSCRPWQWTAFQCQCRRLAVLVRRGGIDEADCVDALWEIAEANNLVDVSRRTTACRQSCLMRFDRGLPHE